ncbi:MAG: 30S ribosomal protein S18 [Bacteriovoracia bacterium]
MEEKTIKPKEKMHDMGMGGDDAEGGSERGERRIIGGSHHRKKACRFCTDAEYVMDYKNIRTMQAFVSEHGRIVPRRISGNCAHHQRKLTTALKRGRNLALIGYVSMGY